MMLVLLGAAGGLCRCVSVTRVQVALWDESWRKVCLVCVRKEAKNILNLNAHGGEDRTCE